MKKLFSTLISIHLSKIILTFLLIALAITAYLYLADKGSIKATSLLAGFVTGLIVVIIQFLFSWNEHRAAEKIKALGIKEVRMDRDKRDFYEQLIRNARSRIDMMGVTASRFMDHFADANTGRPETCVLLDAMNRGVKVRIMVPAQEYLQRPEEKENAVKAKRVFENVAQQFSNFEYRHFAHVPAHGIVVVDEECIIGPVFPHLRSKDTPCIYISTTSGYTQKYLEYFEKEWVNAG